MYPGYVEPIYLEPVYQQRTAYGAIGCPFSCPYYEGTVGYQKGLCPVTERMHYDELIYTDICHASITGRDLDDFIRAFQKVSDYLNESEL